MKGTLAVLALVFVMAGGTGIVMAQQGASVEKGKALFNDAKLGTNGKTCNTCHSNGKGLAKAGAKNELPNIVNACITKALGGTALDANSVDMQSMVMYIKTFSEKAPAKRKAPVGC